MSLVVAPSSVSTDSLVVAVENSISNILSTMTSGEDVAVSSCTAVSTKNCPRSALVVPQVILSSSSMAVTANIASLVGGESDGTVGRLTEVELGAVVEEEEIYKVEQRARSLSPRGKQRATQREFGSLVVDIFNLDSIIQQV